MRNAWLLARGSLRRHPGQSLVFVLLTILTALLLNTGLMAGTNFAGELTRHARFLDAEDVLLVVGGRDTAGLEHTLTADERVADVAVRDAIVAPVSFQEKGGTISTLGVIHVADQTSLGRTSVEDGRQVGTADREVYLPRILAPEHEIGSTVTLEFGSKKFEVKVAGTADNMLLGFTNIGVLGFAVPQDTFAGLAKDLGPAAQGRVISLRLHHASDAGAVTTTAVNHLHETGAKAKILSSPTQAKVIAFRTMTASITTAVLITFGVVILCVTGLMIRFRVGNAILDDQHNLGALKAIGLRARVLKLVAGAPYVVLTLLGGLIGLGLSFCLLPPLARSFSLQSGFEWRPGPDPLAMSATLGILVLTTALVAWASVRPIAALRPLAAIHGRALERNRSAPPPALRPAPWGLFGTLTLHRLRTAGARNALITLIMTGVSVAAGFAGIMYSNIAFDNSAFAQIVAGETADLSLTESPKSTGLAESLSRQEGVERAIYYQALTVTWDKERPTAYVTDDFAKLRNPGTFVGTSPQSADEVALNGQLAKKRHVSVGDTVTLTLGSQNATYTVVGLTQSGRGGNDLQLTTTGYRRLDPAFQPTGVNVYLRNGVNAQEYRDSIVASRGDAITTAVNVSAITQNQLAAFLQIIGIIALAMVIGTAVIIALVLYLVLGTVMTQSRREFSTFKALGFTNRQIVGQLAVSLVPPLTVGTVIGIILCAVGTNPVMSIAMAPMGMTRTNFRVQPWLLTAIAVGIILFGVIASLAMASRVRRILPISLLREEP